MLWILLWTTLPFYSVVHANERMKVTGKQQLHVHVPQLPHEIHATIMDDFLYRKPTAVAAQVLPPLTVTSREEYDFAEDEVDLEFAMTKPFHPIRAGTQVILESLIDVDSNEHTTVVTLTMIMSDPHCPVPYLELWNDATEHLGTDRKRFQTPYVDAKSKSLLTFRYELPLDTAKEPLPSSSNIVLIVPQHGHCQYGFRQFDKRDWWLKSPNKHFKHLRPGDSYPWAAQ